MAQSRENPGQIEQVVSSADCRSAEPTETTSEHIPEQSASVADGQQAAPTRQSAEPYRLDPAKQRARGTVRRAVRSGKIVKPDRCLACKRRTPVAELHGHHPAGYDNPLEIEWLCRKCHQKVHAPTKPPKRKRKAQLPQIVLLFRQHPEWNWFDRLMAGEPIGPDLTPKEQQVVDRIAE